METYDEMPFLIPIILGLSNICVQDLGVTLEFSNRNFYIFQILENHIGDLEAPVSTTKIKYFCTTSKLCIVIEFAMIMHFMCTVGEVRLF